MRQLANLYKACPGIVRSYDGATKTITVQPVTNRPITDADGQLSHEAQPEIQNVPVEFFGSSNLSVVTELEQGDSVLLVFLDYSPAGWRRTGKPADAGDARAHGPSYCVAFPWYRPSGGAGQDQDTASIGKPGGPVRVHFDCLHLNGPDLLLLLRARRPEARRWVLATLRRQRGNVLATAAALGVSSKALYRAARRDPELGLPFRAACQGLEGSRKAAAAARERKRKRDAG